MNYSVIKEGDLFFLTDKNGDITANDEIGHGLYTQDTRFLSQMEIFIDDEKPTLLSSVATKSYLASMWLMKEHKDEGAIEIHRDRYIYKGVLYEKFTLTNYFPQNTKFNFSVAFDADFQDMFIVRKYRTGEVGKIVGRDKSSHSISIHYQGADNIERTTEIQWDKDGAFLDNDGVVEFSLELNPQQVEQICFRIVPHIGDQDQPHVYDFEEGLRLLEQSYEDWYANNTRVTTDSEVFDGLYRRGVQDLRMLMTDVGYGDMPVAGLPWFAVPFGRDSLITSLFMLPLNPANVKGTLKTMAAYQGTKTDPWRDEEPGKIMHEIRFGELANTNQSPFSPYYGTVDSTPLFLILLGEYVRWTGDLSLVTELRAHIDRALEWMDQRCIQSNSAFLTYHQEAEKGFPNQGWKDSSNSMVHQTGEYARTPIALVEVQGYIYHAKQGLIPVFDQLGERELARRLEADAATLKATFEQAFWMDDEQFYAVALDKDQQQVYSVTSNPGHLLMTGISDSARARLVAQRLVADDMFNGYGVRTMSTEAVGYYPMSYHNGSVWPHDNAMILLGLNRLGYQQEACTLISGLLEASTSFEYQRLPELFCGYSSEVGAVITYPTTCSPQAWAAGASVVFLQTILGLDPDVLAKKVRIHPFLPETIDHLVAENIHIGNGILSLELTRSSNPDEPIIVEVLDNTTGLELIRLK